MIYCIFTSILTIIDENLEPVEAFFEQDPSAATPTLRPIPEYLDFLSFFQVRSWPPTHG